MSLLITHWLEFQTSEDNNPPKGQGFYSTRSTSQTSKQ
jgi:hypothetical protein